MNYTTRFAIASFLCALPVSAHFIFVLPDNDKSSVRIIINETLEPGDVGIELVPRTHLMSRVSGGSEHALTLEKGGNFYSATLPGQGTRLISGVADLGVMKRGDKPNLLIYYPKAIAGDAYTSGLLTNSIVELSPVGKPGATRLRLTTKGQPVPNSEITVLLPDGKETKVKTDSSGLTTEMQQMGRYGAWARLFEPIAGEKEGAHYDEIRNYATLVFDAASAVPVAQKYAQLPEGTSAFGAVADGRWMYIYGGHILPTHQYSTAAVSGRFSRMSLTGDHKWEDLSKGVNAQGLNLAAYHGSVYRVGGMSPTNAPGTPSNTVSVPEAMRYDENKREWKALPALPSARSSHDVAVIDGKLYVIGGWNLKGKEGEDWSTTMEVLDLNSANATWTAIPQPFKRRALIIAVHADKIYVLGGFDDKSRFIRNVSIFDPKTGAWSEGPQLTGGPLNAFAPAAVEHKGALYVSLGDGTLQRLDETAAKWITVAKGSPRVAHRMVSDGKRILIIGGAEDGKNLDLVEAVEL